MLLYVYHVNGEVWGGIEIYIRIYISGEGKGGYSNCYSLQEVCVRCVRRLKKRETHTELKKRGVNNVLLKNKYICL